MPSFVYPSVFDREAGQVGTPFTILHLSDAHLGNPKYRDNSMRVFETLFEDIASVHREHSVSPNLIIFSGDMAFGALPDSPLKDQYETARGWISRIYAALETDSSTAPLFIVPGNHDIDRSRIESAHTAWVAALTEKDGPKVYSEMQDNTMQWQRFLERQEEWREFALSQPSANLWSLDRQLFMSMGAIVHEGHTIALAGLNSCWSCSAEDAQGRIWIGSLQLERAVNQVEASEFKILVSHHPPYWLHEPESNNLEEKSELHFNLYLHGHVHDQWYSDRTGHLRIGAGPCYEGADKLSAYSWISIDFDRRAAHIILRARLDKGQGRWGPYFISGKTSEAGLATAHHLFERAYEGGPVGSFALSGASTPDQAEPDLQQCQVGFRNLADSSKWAETLEDEFGFLWEQGTLDGADSKMLVYWPVRLRQPTPIHAVQAFAAAGLSLLGAHVVLCIDDLGNTGGAKAHQLRDRVLRWFKAVKADPAALEVVKFSDVLRGDMSTDIWKTVHRWLGQTDYSLAQVLLVSKILGKDEETLSLADLYRRKPRRLLTPALVWACLAYCKSRARKNRIITLGGFDERGLWNAWRELIDLPEVKLGHLYGPELINTSGGAGPHVLHMADTDLGWTSKQDAVDAFSRDMVGRGDWAEPHRLVPWCFDGCVRLPAFMTGQPVNLRVGSSRIDSISDIAALENPLGIIRPLADKVKAWIL